ncbi:MAG: hypothetical protein FJ125_18370, partial [Deltaproteobacteria bacterium]|nr:hypothetical protein [Deltaproteobacteria bacterium]
AAEGWVGCDAPAPTTEICNLRDDDCNGFVDDVVGRGAPCLREAELPDGVHGCPGVKLCVPGEEQLHCTAPLPVPERCNLADDDCDGEVDEDFPQLGQPCPVGQGSCLRIGAFVCDPQEGTARCSAVPGEQQAEVCNYADDDCDGFTDEDFRSIAAGGDGVEGAAGDLDAYTDPEHCGACGRSCLGLFPHATARCAAGQPLPACVVESCEPGFFRAAATVCLPLEDPSCQLCAADLHCQLPGNRCLELDGGRHCGRDCAAGNLYGTAAGWCPEGFGCQPLPELGEGVAQCLPVSGSCSCRRPDEAGATRSCLSRGELGACAGLQLCDPETGWSPCSAAPPAAEVCNGQDDDCDGALDEEVAAPEEPCRQAGDHGSCPGEWRCAGEQGWQCSAAEPQAESCNYRDDDCDDTTDEGFLDPESGAYLGPEDCGRCGFSCAGAVLYAAAAACALEDGAAVCVAEQCAEGFFSPPGTRRICIPTAAGFDCSPCLDDAHCDGLAGGRCLPQGEEGRFC